MINYANEPEDSYWMVLPVTKAARSLCRATRRKTTSFTKQDVTAALKGLDEFCGPLLLQRTETVLLEPMRKVPIHFKNEREAHYEA